MPVTDGPSCPGCGLLNYSGLCPYCSGDQVRYEEELVPPFPTSMPLENGMDPFCRKCGTGLSYIEMDAHDFHCCRCAEERTQKMLDKAIDEIEEVINQHTDREFIKNRWLTEIENE